MNQSAKRSRWPRSWPGGDDRSASGQTGASWAGLWAALFIGLAAALPLLGGRIPGGADTLLHLFRLTQLDALFERGIFYSRWAPDLAYGYGYPLFNYYAPGVYYLAQIPRLLGFTLPAAFNLTTIFLLLLASAGAYLWAADLAGRSGALASAAAFAFAPYLLMNVLHRGALAEIMALALLPLLLWLLHRAVSQRRLMVRLAFLLSFALLIITHNISALIMAPVLLLYMLILDGASGQDRTPAEKLRRALADVPLLLVAVGLTAWYWLPALAEQHLVQLSRGTMLDEFRVENNFLNLAEIFAGPFFLDVKLVNLHFPLSLNLVVVLLAVTGLAGWRSSWIRQIDRLHLGLAAGLSLLLVILMLPLSESLWTSLPLVRFLQFPWRLLGLTSLFLALLAGYGLEYLQKRLPAGRPGSLLLPAAAVLAIASFALPWTFVEYLALPEDLTMADSFRYEVESGALGTTSTGEYLPVHVQQLPAVAGQDGLEVGEKLDPVTLPAGATLVAATYDPLEYSLVIETPEPFTAVFKTFFFEGWEAALDGRPAAVKPTQPGGLLSVDIPAGEHALRVSFESTAERRWGLAIAAACLLFLAAMIAAGRRPDQAGTEREIGGPSPPVGAVLASILLVLALYLSGRWWFLARYAPANSPYDGQQVQTAGSHLQVNYGRQLELIGLSVPPQVSADQPLAITLFWRALTVPETDYSVSLSLLDPAGILLGQSDKQHIANAATSHWSPDKYARDDHRLLLAPGTPPGLYDLKVAVYLEGRPADRLNVLDALGNPAGQVSAVGQVRVERPERAPTPAELAIPTPLTVDFGGGVRLLGAGLTWEEAWAGESFLLDLYWEAAAIPASDLSVAVWLVDDQGQAFEVTKGAPLPGYPTGQWRPGDRWRGRQQILLPPWLAAGRYDVRVGPDPARLTTVGALAVNAPDHLMTPPAVSVALDVPLGRVAILTGANLPGRIEAGQPLSVTLAWRSSGETQTSYRSFVQLLDEQGGYTAGSDQVPASWQRPTTGWISGEYILDSHTLWLPERLPPGVYRLVAGLYDAASGQRLASEAGVDSLAIGEYTLP